MCLEKEASRRSQRATLSADTAWGKGGGGVREPGVCLMKEA